LKGGNTALKLQLRDLRQICASPKYISTETASSTHDGSARTYRDVLSSGGGHPDSTTETVSGTHDTASRTSRDVSSSGGGHSASTAVSSGPNWHAALPELPESTAMASGNQAADGLTTILKKRKGNHPTSVPLGVPNLPRRTRTPLIGNKSGSSLTTVLKRVQTKALFILRLSPEVSSSDVEQSLKDQLERASLACTKRKTKFNSYSSFHVAVSEDGFHLINNGCLIAPYYGLLNPDQIYSADKSAMSRPPSPAANVPTPDHTDAPVEGNSSLA
jgi:hypothetical protein